MTNELDNFDGKLHFEPLKIEQLARTIGFLAGRSSYTLTDSDIDMLKTNLEAGVAFLTGLNEGRLSKSEGTPSVSDTPK